MRQLLGLLNREYSFAIACISVKKCTMFCEHEVMIVYIVDFLIYGKAGWNNYTVIIIDIVIILKMVGYFTF